MSSIDVVIPWVDGDDPEYRARKEAWCKNKSLIVAPGATDETRFTNNGELYLCIRSVIEFMPWVRHIFVLTDGQYPTFIDPSRPYFNKVQIVDHKEVFRDHMDVLPVYNSRTIGTAAMNIIGLAERFI